MREAAELRVPSGQPIELPRAGSLLENKYQVEEKLGEGGMGAVFRACNVETGKQVAIKWLLGQSPQAGLRFSREARVTARIDHPNVVNVFDSGSHQGGRYLVMELLRGESLGTRIRRERVPADELVEIMIPVLRGLAAAHRAGVIHRDLKPDNVFLCVGTDGATYEPKVLDFGISKLRSARAVSRSGSESPASTSRSRTECASTEEHLTGQGTGLGTVAYMSPEQLVDALNVDERTDIYAAGVMMYEALTGCLPFRAEGYNALVLAIAGQRPLPISALVSDVPRALERIVMRAMAKEPRDRQPDAQTLIDELEGFRRASLTGERPAVPARSPSLRWVWAACLGLPLAASIWFAGHPPEPMRRTGPAASAAPSLARARSRAVQPTSEHNEQAAARTVAMHETTLTRANHTGESEVARATEVSTTRAALPARTARLVQTRQSRASARSNAGTFRLSDL